MLREYQQRSIIRLREKYAQGFRAPCLVLPTGGGKTVVAAEIIRSAVARGNSVLFAAHRQELIAQSVAKLEHAGVTDLRIIQASNDFGSRVAAVTVASIPTLASKRWRENPIKAGLCILDECHHTPAKTWASLAETYRGSLLLGLTATPQRADSKPLGDIFDAIVVGATVRELTDLKHLVPCHVYAPPHELESAQLAQSPVEAYQKHGNGGRAVIFCVTVEHAQRAAEEMNAAGIPTGVIHGAMGRELRRETLARLESGSLHAVASCHVLTEGWDSPAVSVCILARKPQHAGLYLQMVGRVLRPYPGKTHATLIDLCGSVHDHGPPDLDREYSLTGRGISKIDRKAICQCPSCGGVFAAGPLECPLCHAPMPRKETEIELLGIGLVDIASLPRLPARSFTLSITAKYPGVCRHCLRAIRIGDEIYWAKGQKPRHVECQEVAA